MKNFKKLHILLLSFLTFGCNGEHKKEIPVVSQVDLARFMGDWYVIASIPTFLEKNAHNGVETYRQLDNGKIATTFTFRDGSFDGEKKIFHPVGTVQEGTGNAVWGMQYIWPIKADYRIIMLSEDYDITVIGRNQRDYVWIMARKPKIEDHIYSEILTFLSSHGYDIKKIKMVPQNW